MAFLSVTFSPKFLAGSIPFGTGFYKGAVANDDKGNPVAHGYGYAVLPAKEYELGPSYLLGYFQFGVPHGTCTKVSNGLTERISYDQGIVNEKISGVVNNSMFTAFLRLVEGGMYYGRIRDGVPHGEGELYYSDGSHFKGRFEEGNMENGTLDYVNGDKYKGELREGKPNAYGTMTYADGQEYTGEWILGRRQGGCSGKFSNGEFFNGTYYQDKPSGTFTLHYKEGTLSLYEGGVKNWMPHGKGWASYRNSDVIEYKGEFENGMRHGLGSGLVVGAGGEGVMCNGIWENDEFVGAQ